MEFFVAPVSSAQRRMCFIDRLEPGNPVYHIPATVRILGKLDCGALEQSVNEIVARHEAMRTTFGFDGEEMVQLIHPELHIEIKKERVESAASLEAALHAEMLVGFDLKNGPLLRCTLYELSEQEFFFRMTMHHIITDGWSIGILIRELSSLYKAFVKNEPSPLAQLDIQYSDYSEWHNEFLESAAVRHQMEYWKKTLEGAPTVLNLPLDYPRPAIQPYRGDVRLFHIDEEVVALIEGLARKEGVTPFMVLLAVFQILLCKYTQQEDFVVGTPIANRNRAEIENLIGLFVNSQALRADLSGDPDFIELLQRAKRTCLGAYENQDLPFETLVDALQPERNRSRTPIFQVMLVLQNAPMGELDFPGLTMEIMDISTETAKFDLALVLERKEKGMIARWEFLTDLFSAETIDQLARHFGNILKSVCREPHRPLSRISILGAEERKNLTVSPAPKSEPVGWAGGIHELFAEQAARNPEGMALAFEGARMSYRELDDTANRVAGYLKQRGVVTGTLVGLCLERSFEMIVGILGILKAGGAYVPLDPAYPADRLAFIISDSKIRVVLTAESAFSAQLKQLAPALEAIFFDANAKEIAAQDANSHDVRVSPEAAAYVIYTSGSTGQPKGVLVSHRNVLRLFSSTDDWFRFDKNDVWTLFHSFAFDFSVWEIWGALLFGGKLVIVPHNVTRTPRDFYRLLIDEKVTVLNQTPSAFKSLMPVDEEARAQLHLRYVVFGGEALEFSLLRSWFAIHGDEKIRLINMYGITETTVHVTYRPICKADAEDKKGSLIGKPIPDLALYILDKNGEPVPLGVAGELYVGGDGLALGYLHRPELTEERFPQNRFGSGRLYRTGDLARRLRDGEIEYLGRMDQQVKIRGFRIELGEIEATLLRHPAVREAAVIAREDTPGNKRLVAYLVKQESCAFVDADVLRNHCAELLPGYMIPAAFVAMDVLPLNNNGKLDVQALQAPEIKSTEGGEVSGVPQSPEEVLLAEVWSKVLNVEEIGIHDNFFEMGGDSILTLLIVSEIGKAGFEITPTQIFDRETIAGLAGVMKRKEQAVTLLNPQEFSLLDENMLARLRKERGEISDLYPLSSMQEGMLFHTLLDPDSGNYFEQVTGVLEGKLEHSDFLKAWQSVVDRHPALRTSFLWLDVESALQMVHPALELPFEARDWRGYTALEQEKLLETFLQEDKSKSFDLARPPLMRLFLARVEDERHLWVWSHHHMLLDGWSAGLIFKEVLHFYAAYRLGKSSATLPEPRLYRDFIAWQKSRDTARAEIYWKEELAGFESPTKLGFSPMAEKGTSGSNLLVEARFSEEETKRLQDWARGQQLTLNTLVQGTWSILLKRMGNEDVVFGVTNSGRPPELEGAGEIVGLFINTLPMRAPLGDEHTVLGWLKALQAKQAKLMEFEYCKLTDVQKWSGIPGGESLFDSLVIFENYPVDPSVTMETAGIRSVGVNSFERTNYPLTLVAGPGKELFFKFHYDADRFGADEVRRMANRFLFLMQAMVDNSQQKVREISLLSEQEKNEILIRWNATIVERGETGCVYELFEMQARRTPDAIALEYGEERISYRELNDRANRTAQQLRQIGVGPEKLVGLCIERSVEMISGFLAVLKAGGALLPLSPRNPEERLLFMLEDSSVSCLLTLERTLANFSELFREEIGHQVTHIVRLDRDCLLPEQQNSANISQASGPGNLAYMIYTSGSTGKPKGALLEHRGLSNLVIDHVRRFDLKTGSRLLQFANLGFDASILEISIALCSGATLCLENEDLLLAGAALAAVLKDKGITHSFLPPTALAGLSSEEFPDLQTLWAAGEACSGELARKWSKSRRFFNAYGPTEATVCSTIHECTDADGDPPIGRPLENIRTYILDPYGQPLPVGIPGELHVSGACLARGYHNRPDLTEQKFIPNPFGQDAGYERLYRTGDLCRYRADGAIEFMGRIDRQVKLRGFRIELGEIESLLKEDDGVFDAAVIVREDIPGNRQLVAYVVPVEKQNANREEGGDLHVVLKSRLAKKLPAYSLPAFYVIMEALPLSHSGKIDRNALPEPDREFAGCEIVAPRNETEKTLAAIWEKVLGVSNVGVKENFFELGGDSILSLQIISLAHQAGIKITPKQIFTLRSIENIALEATPIEQNLFAGGEETGDVPLAPIQRWFFEQQQPDSHHWNQSLLLEVRVPLETRLLARALEAVRKRHQALAFRYERNGDNWRQFVAENPEPVQVLEFDLSGDGGEWAERMEEIASGLQAGLNLLKGPLMQAAYFKTRDAESDRFLLIFHHLVIDGVSWRIVVGDLMTAYHQLEKGEEPFLPPVPASYHQWSATRKKHADTAAVRNQIDYWATQEAVAAVQVDYPENRAVNLALDAKSVTSYLQESETGLLLREVPAAYGTQINDVLLSALLVAFHKWTGQKVLRINLEGHGRNDMGDGLDVSGTVGWFTCIYPVLLRLDREDSPGELLKSVKEQLRSIPTSGIGYGLLRYACDEEDAVRGKLASLPEPEISFNYLGQTGQLQGASPRFAISNESSGAAASPKSRRFHLLDIVCMVVNEQLKIDFMFNEKIHERKTIGELSEHFTNALVELIQHCVHPDAGGYTPSDFDMVDLDDEELNSILIEIE